MPVHSPIMLALCFMLLVTYYALSYAGIIDLGLIAYKELVLKNKNEKDNDLDNGLWHHNEGRAQLLD